MTEVRKGQAPAHLSRDEFGARFRRSFYDPAFEAEAPRHRAARGDRLAGLHRGPQGAADAEGRAPASPIPTTTCRSSGSRRASACDAAQRRGADPASPLARAR